MDQPPSADTPGSGRGGFWLPLDVLVAPTRAFATIEATHQWLWAYSLLVGLGLIELYLLAPALAHVVAIESHAGAAAVGPGAAFREALIFEGAWRVVGPLAAWGFVAMLLGVASLGGRGGPGSVGMFFSLCTNCAVPAWIGGVVSALAVRLHDPSTFRTPDDLLLAAPISLASLRPHGQPREIAFLGYWDAFTLWTFVLLGVGYAAVARVRPVPAVLFSLAIGLSFALMQAVAV